MSLSHYEKAALAHLRVQLNNPYQSSTRLLVCLFPPQPVWMFPVRRVRMSSTHPDEAAQVTARIAPPRSGQVIPVGGAEELDPTASQSILAEFLRLSGGKRAHLAIIPTASG